MKDRGSKTEPPKPGLLAGLSGKVLLLTIVFVMLGEVLIFLPSIANFRIQWLKTRISQAEIAALAAEAAPDQIVSSDLKSEILNGAGVLVVSLLKGETRKLILRSDERPHDRCQFRSARGALVAGDHGRLRCHEPVPPASSGSPTSRPTCPAISSTSRFMKRRCARRCIATGSTSFSCRWSCPCSSPGWSSPPSTRVLVQPMQRLTRNMVAFGENPEDPSRIIAPTARRDEIGIAERELHGMQSELAAMLQQKNQLAALGLAVSKVSHDLRNMLSSAQLISDRLAMLQDPTVQRFAPKLIASLDRAIEFLTQTLKFGRAQELPPARERLVVKDIADEVIDSAIVQTSSRVVFYNNAPASVIADADREQLGRVLTNLTRNAIQALEAAQAENPDAPDGSVTVRAWREGSVVTIEVKDNGPGVPERIRDKLFEPFQSAARSGGTGLGLAIAAELVRAHGGEIRLHATGESGTSFIITFPDSVAELRTGRRGERKPMPDS